MSPSTALAAAIDGVGIDGSGADEIVRLGFRQAGLRGDSAAGDWASTMSIGMYPQIGCVDGKGLVAALACVKPGTQEPDGDLAFDIIQRCVEKGVLMFSPVGFGGGSVKISPPLVITEEALDESCSVLEEAIAEVLTAREAVA